jgi:fatty-acyl-CoA synthase
MEKPLLAPEFLDRARKYFGDHEAVLTVEGDRVESGDRVAVLDPNTHYHLETAYAAIVADPAFVDNVDPVRDQVPVETFICTDAEPANV